MSVPTPLSGKVVELCGVSVDVRSENPAFSAYLDNQFPFSSSFGAAMMPGQRQAPSNAATNATKPPLQSGGENAAIRSLVRWTEGPRPDFDPGKVFPGWEAGEQLDRYIHASPDGLLWLRVDDVPQIAIASNWKGGRRSIELRYHFTLGAGPFLEPLKRLARWRWLPAKRRHRFSTIVYYAVYYPVWWHLECTRAAHPLHAGAVVLDGKAILLAGLPGSGKSTVAVSFLNVPEAALLSDNIVLHDGTNIWGCYEPLLLGDEHSSRPAGLHQTGQRHAFNRNAYHAPHLNRAFSPSAVVILCRGKRTELEAIPNSQCFRMLLAINEAAKEMRRYHVFGAVFSIAESRGLECALTRVSRLEQMVGSLPCFRLHVREGAPEEAVNELTRLSSRTITVAR